MPSKNSKTFRRRVRTRRKGKIRLTGKLLFAANCARTDPSLINKGASKVLTSKRRKGTVAVPGEATRRRGGVRGGKCRTLPCSGERERVALHMNEKGNFVSSGGGIWIVGRRLRLSGRTLYKLTGKEECNAILRPCEKEKKRGGGILRSSFGHI